MKLTLNEIVAGKWQHNATQPWSKHTVPTGSNAAIELDAYGVYVAEAIDADIYIREAVSAASAASIDCDGYGLLVRTNVPTVLVGQWGYDGSFHLAARSAETVAAKIRLLKVDSRLP